MHADKPFRHAEIAQRAARARAKYSADHFELDNPTLCEDDESTMMLMSDRDPREDPRLGDVLSVDGDVREVLRCRDGRVEYGFPGKAATRSIPRILWTAWARKADVEKVAP